MLLRKKIVFLQNVIQITQNSKKEIYDAVCHQFTYEFHFLNLNSEINQLL